MSRLCNWFINNEIGGDEFGYNEELINNGDGGGSGSGYGNSIGFCYASHPNDLDYYNGISCGYGIADGHGYKNGLIDIPYKRFRGFLDE